MGTGDKLQALFSIGEIVATSGAFQALSRDATLAAMLVARHASGDFGDIDAEDKATNRAAIKHGNRILSAYKLIGGEKLWIITEADRSVTTILLPAEY